MNCIHMVTKFNLHSICKRCNVQRGIKLSLYRLLLVKLSELFLVWIDLWPHCCFHLITDLSVITGLENWKICTDRHSSLLSCHFKGNL